MLFKKPEPFSVEGLIHTLESGFAQRLTKKYVTMIAGDQYWF